VEGLKCGNKNDCPAGSEYSSRTGALVAVIIVSFVLYGIFLVKYFLERKVRNLRGEG
jgi:hypothetical protein